MGRFEGIDCAVLIIFCKLSRRTGPTDQVFILVFVNFPSGKRKKILTGRALRDVVTMSAVAGPATASMATTTAAPRHREPGRAGGCVLRLDAGYLQVAAPPPLGRRSVAGDYRKRRRIARMAAAILARAGSR